MKTTQEFLLKKQRREAITMLTCYDYTMARILNESQIDSLLVGDSLSMVVDGETTTLSAEVEVVARHVRAVVKGAPDKFVIGDLPFMSYRKDFKSNVEAAEILMKAGAQAVKLEGLRGNESLIRHYVESGIPVMGHLGLTPQSVHALGGFKVQAREPSQVDQLLSDARELEACGCFAVVLECVPAAVAEKVARSLEIPVIGIGAGAHVDGQILVVSDLLGLNKEFKPRFVRRYLEGHELIKASVNKYCLDVGSKDFPSSDESYSS